MNKIPMTSRTHTVALLLGAVTLCGCLQDFDPPTVIACPPTLDFAPVSNVLEQRCGTIDCYGNIARPLRIYGFRGTRLYDDVAQHVDDNAAEQAFNFPGGRATTEAERLANHRSVCGLEPEKTTLVTKGELEPEALLLMRKPLGLEHHKGANLFIKGGPGFICVESWLLGATDPDECTLAVKNP